MGNKHGKRRDRSAHDSDQPGKPEVRLVSPKSHRRHVRERTVSSETSDPDDGYENVSDEILLKWKPVSRRHVGYEIEMWDLGLQEWVRVAESEKPECTLANILSGIMYRFRVTGHTQEGETSEPSDPSDPFVIDLPGVHIAPYWIHTPPSIVSLTLGQTLRLRAQALGTPRPSFHWYRGSQELFVDERISINEEREDESQITVNDVEPSDAGVFRCAAINLMGKCIWETKVDVKARPQFTMPGSLKKAISVAQDEMLRVKVPLVGMPEPIVTLERLDDARPFDRKDVKLQFRNNCALLQIDSAQINHSGRWKITATNPIGSDSAIIEILVTGTPKPPSQPDVEEISSESVRLTWEDCSMEDIWTTTGPMSYRVEYNRQNWDIWLRGNVVSDRSCVLTDLIPGSFYKFRIRTVTKTGTVSEPGPESEPVFLGTPLEDEVFGLPGNNYPKETSGGRLVHFGSCRNSKHFGSYSNLDFPSGPITTRSSQNGVSPVRKTSQVRQASLDRDVFYFDNDRREEVVTYKKPQFVLGASVKKFGLSEAEESIYKASLGNLCSQLSKVSKNSLNNNNNNNNERSKQSSSRLSLEKVLQRMESTSGDEKDSVSSQTGHATKYEVSKEEKRRLEASLSDLCFKLKAVSQKNISVQGERKKRGFSESRGLSGNVSLDETSYSAFSGFAGPRHPLRKATSCVDAHKALEDSCSRISSMQSLLSRPLSQASLSSLAKIDLTERYLKNSATFLQHRPSVERDSKERELEKPKTLPFPDIEEKEEIFKQNILTYRDDHLGSHQNSLMKSSLTEESIDENVIEEENIFSEEAKANEDHTHNESVTNVNSLNENVVKDYESVINESVVNENFVVENVVQKEVVQETSPERRQSAAEQRSRFRSGLNGSYSVSFSETIPDESMPDHYFIETRLTEVSEESSSIHENEMSTQQIINNNNPEDKSAQHSLQNNNLFVNQVLSQDLSNKNPISSSPMLCSRSPIPPSPSFDSRSTSRASEATLHCAASSFDETEASSRTLMGDHLDSDNYLSDYSCDNV